MAIFSFCFVVFSGFIAVFGYLIAPDNSQNANQMHLEIHSKEPGFSVDILTIPLKEKKTQSFFNRLFMGNTQMNTEIAIKSYRILEDELEYTGYNDEYSKKINLNLLNNSPKKYINKENFLFWNRQIWSRFVEQTTYRNKNLIFYRVYCCIYIFIYWYWYWSNCWILWWVK